MNNIYSQFTKKMSELSARKNILITGFKVITEVKPEIINIYKIGKDSSIYLKNKQ